MQKQGKARKSKEKEGKTWKVNEISMVARSKAA
jgi:hypothetical protein